MRSIVLKIRLAIQRMIRNTASSVRAERIGELSRWVRDESMRINVEFAGIEGDTHEAREMGPF
jgi:hypothetical protein